MDVLFNALIFSAIFGSGVMSKSLGTENNFSSDGKIVGGFDATITDFPYQAFVLLRRGNNLFQCGGSIISNRAILTAAHCLQGMTSATVRIGSTNSDSGGTQYASAMLLVHPLFDTRPNDYDIGVIITAQNMTLDGVTSRNVTLAARGAAIANNTQVFVSGWGATSEDGSTSTTLMAVQTPTITNDECNTEYDGIITARMFCAGLPEGGKDSCQGDSGGPAVQMTDGVQIGVVSFGFGCARPNFAGVYTRIAAVRTWIRIVSGV